MSATFTIRMDEDEKQRLEALAKSTGRSRSYLAADAIRSGMASGRHLLCRSIAFE
jgi:predicted transcriptional regulator